MTTKHTPGPWKIDDATDLPLAVIVGNDESDEDGMGICEIGAPTQTRDEAAPEQFANARLIAAAPRLLAELKALADQFDLWVEHGDAAVEQPDTRDAWAAILEAEGGAE